jgi:hypothetical protein
MFDVFHRVVAGFNIQGHDGLPRPVFTSAFCLTQRLPTPISLYQLTFQQTKFYAEECVRTPALTPSEILLLRVSSQEAFTPHLLL